MKVLVVSNMYPSPQKPYAGIFVKNQFMKMKELMQDDEVSLFYMKRTFTGSIGSIWKYAAAGFRFIPLFLRKFDVIHVHFFYPLIILACAYKMIHKNCKVVVTFHGTDITKHVKSKRNIKLYAAILKKTDFVIAVGKDLATEVEGKLKHKVHQVLSAGVDNRIFFKEKSVEKRFQFLFVGSFIERKGVDIVLDAIRIINDKTISFCFVGSGECLVNIKALKNEGFNVTILENQTQEQLRNIYNASKFFVLPSRNEPFGLVVTEALYCGIPCIVSDNGGLKEQVTERINGFLLPGNNGVQLSLAMLNSIKMPVSEYERMASAALQSNKDKSLQEVCESLRNIYRKISHAA